jgi:uncharacterized membrane protein YbhN (UPF0104 family)
MSEPSKAAVDLRPSASRPAPPKQPPSGRNRGTGRVLWPLLRWAVAIAAFWYLLGVADTAEMVSAFKRISLVKAALALTLMYGSAFVGATRWRFILQAYGASRLPSVLRLTRLQLVAVFYNTFLPGAVGGDVVRGFASRDAFGESGTASSLAVVLVDRAAGLAGLLAVATAAFVFNPLPGVGGVTLWGPLGLLASASTVSVLALGRASARFLPEKLAGFARSLPELRSARPFLFVLAVTVLNWIVLAVAGHLLVSSIDSDVKLGDSFVIIPLAAAAVFFPLTVAGVGAREAAFVLLFRTVGVSDADALAASLSFFACQLVVALSGGVLSVLFPLSDSQLPRVEE